MPSRRKSVARYKLRPNRPPVVVHTPELPPGPPRTEMPPAAMSLVCKDALGIFAQYHTLKLQGENQRLARSLARHEYKPTVMRCDVEGTRDDPWRRVVNIDQLLQWVDENVHGCEWEDLLRYGQIGAICDEMALTQAIEDQMKLFWESPAFCARQAETIIEQIDLVMTFISRYDASHEAAANLTASCAKKMLGDMLEEAFCRFEFRNRRYICEKCNGEDLEELD